MIELKICYPAELGILPLEKMNTGNRSIHYVKQDTNYDRFSEVRNLSREKDEKPSTVSFQCRKVSLKGLTLDCEQIFVMKKPG